MSTIKNSQILVYCHFNKIIKGPETSFQSPALSQNMLEMFVIQYISIGTSFNVVVLRIQKNKHERERHRF